MELLSGDGPIADITAAKLAFPSNLISQLISLMLGFTHSITKCYSAKDAPTVSRDQALIIEASSSMKNLTRLTKLLREANDVTFRVSIRLTFGSEHHANGWTTVPMRDRLVQHPHGACHTQFDNTILKTHQDGLRFWITKTAVKFQHLWGAVGIYHDASVKKPCIDITIGSHAVNRWHNDFIHNTLVQGRINHRGG